MDFEANPPEKTEEPAGPVHVDAPSLYVGIGASAGGLEALETFFKNMPAGSGLAFVVVQHLSPDYKSLMVELLSKHTRMPVCRAEEGMRVEPDSVYLIPPKKNLSIFHGRLLLRDQDPNRGINLPIDIFLRSLADDQEDKAVAVVLSGTGSDGMRGVRAVKEKGGMVMVQSEETARFDGMPKAAISTGLSDFVLAPDQMPAQLLSYVKHPCVTQNRPSERLLTDEDGMARIFSLLREKTKVDFTFYKPSTVGRRIERRMTVNQINDLTEYVRFLELHPGEAAVLHRELLIGVTSFFRDRPAFELLEQKWLPQLVGAKKQQRADIRIWVPGCSTGEEAYTLAICCRQAMERTEKFPDVKIFATDLDREAILHAGQGKYPESIAADLPAGLLSKYFYRMEDNFQISRSIREMVVFAHHNLIKDPPFTNIDLISCRNLLIYLQPVLQRKVLELFNFSLNPGGFLLLGTSETTGELADYFESLHHKWKVYRALGKDRGGRNAASSDRFLEVPSPVPEVRPRFGKRAVKTQEEERVLERLLEAVAGRYFTVALVVTEQMAVLHVIGDTEGLFKLPSGRMQNDVTKMAAKNLSIPLATGIQKAFRKNEEVRFSNIRMGEAKHARSMLMRVVPMRPQKSREAMAAVLFEEMPAKTAAAGQGVPADYDLSREAEQRISDLEQELQFTKENLQATIEELETSNEELQATNEELLASNEELQSTNEELHSVNEELYTVNAEYQKKIIELTELNNDMDNLLNSTRIGTLFLDENLQIRKFTPRIADIYKIVDTDVGRPISHLAHRLEDADPLSAVRRVIRDCSPEEAEVRNEGGSWYLMRIFPYQIGPEAYAGAVLIFIQIDRLKRSEEELRRERDLVAGIMDASPAPITVVDRQGRITFANRRAEEVFNLSRQQITQRTYNHPEWEITDFDGRPLAPGQLPFERVMSSGETVYGARHAVNTADGRRILLSINAAPLTDESGRVDAMVSVLDDVTEKVRAGDERDERPCRQKTGSFSGQADSQRAVKKGFETGEAS